MEDVKKGSGMKQEWLLYHNVINTCNLYSPLYPASYLQAGTATMWLKLNMLEVVFSCENMKYKLKYIVSQLLSYIAIEHVF